jgi:hypothetical protein
MSLGRFLFLRAVRTDAMVADAVQWAELIMHGKVDLSGLLNRPIGASRLSKFRR